MCTFKHYIVDIMHIARNYQNAPHYNFVISLKRITKSLKS